MSAIDDQIRLFFDRMAFLSWTIDDYENWMRSYEEHRYEYPAWVMRDGGTIRIYRMTDEHIANTIILLRRRDPEDESGWQGLLKQEQQFRRLYKKVVTMRTELERMKEVSEICL